MEPEGDWQGEEGRPQAGSSEGSENGPRVAGWGCCTQASVKGKPKGLAVKEEFRQAGTSHHQGSTVTVDSILYKCISFTY